MIQAGGERFLLAPPTGAYSVPGCKEVQLLLPAKRGIYFHQIGEGGIIRTNRGYAARRTL